MNEYIYLNSSKLFKHTYDFEPDRVALQSLSNNTMLNSNDFDGNGDLGNSESTLLVRDIVSYCKKVVYLDKEEIFNHFYDIFNQHYILVFIGVFYKPMK